ncbi:TetR/AcrR family transcriptional regulator [Pseudorhodoferax sp.]|uniref:TetR/AcrR family transcriptional regulator n=1 Tax=Pseudorhodoferax sp. TaxID=1993553 RepID=UPI002DD69189|nr:TetR/AcrR family transcriptional regulator [Pseudorhodoferax sp.]
MQKIELMLEAATQLLESGEVAALTTNAVAARAGVSIGTLYQYFGDKQALLDALVQRELGAMSEQILAATAHAPAGGGAPGEQVRRIVRAVVGAYGGRSQVHRRLIEHALTHASGGRLSPLYTQLTEGFAARGVAAPGEAPTALSQAQAFVLTHAVAGVLRALAASAEPPPLRAVEDAVVQLATAYVAAIRAAGAAQCANRKGPPT